MTLLQLHSSNGGDDPCKKSNLRTQWYVVSAQFASSEPGTAPFELRGCSKTREEREDADFFRFCPLDVLVEQR